MVLCCHKCTRSMQVLFHTDEHPNLIKSTFPWLCYADAQLVLAAHCSVLRKTNKTGYANWNDEEELIDKTHNEPIVGPVIF